MFYFPSPIVGKQLAKDGLSDAVGYQTNHNTK
jgi:hypothetical protein